MHFSDVLKSRVSTRAFDSRPIPDGAVKSLIDAALYAPVGMHRLETLHLTVIRNPYVLEHIRTLAVKATGDEKADPLHGAPVLIVVSTSQGGEIGALNVSCLIENMLLAATDMGLANLYVRGIIADAAKDADFLALSGIPEGFTPVASVAAGYALAPIAPRETPKNDVTTINYVD